MGIYFRDILLIRISRGANNCGQHSLEKNSYFIMRFSPHFQLFYFNDRLEFCEFFEWKIKRINNADLFSQPPLLIFIKGANISGGHCINTHTCMYIFKKNMLHLYIKFLFAYKTTTGTAPIYLNLLVQTYAPSRSLRSASERRLVVPSQRGSKSLSWTFSWTVSSWWNDLPISIPTAESLAIFKKHLKTHLFRQHLTN